MLTEKPLVLVSSPGFLGLGELQMQLGGADLGHQGSRSLEVGIQDVERGRLVIGPRGLVELSRLEPKGGPGREFDIRSVDSINK